MEIAEDLGLTTFNIKAAQLPSIVLKLLGLARPFYLPAIDEIQLPEQPIDQVILVIIDNFSLFEIVAYQPSWMIKNLENLLLIETPDKSQALSEPMLKSIFFSKESLTFNLMNSLHSNSKNVKAIVREEDVPKVTIDPSLASAEKSDINIYVKSVKAINRIDFLVIHFSDFDEMYARYSMNPPEDIASKIMRRTDKWLNLFWQQAIAGTALLVIGNDGRKPIEMALSGKAAEWKRANLPIGFIKFPKKE
ncbi:MAG: hypothetical protein FK730_11190 [Asgard group archaeon]|nr:hypothetical protein [Asgard group archaeon]